MYPREAGRLRAKTAACFYYAGDKSMTQTQEVTALLLAWSHGDQSALEKPTPLVHQELRRLARAQMRRERLGHSLQTSALVNEAYLRLVDTRQVQWQNRAHFFAVAANLMRRILVDFARTRQNQKRGGKMQKVSLAEALAVTDERELNLVALDDALRALARVNPRQSQVVELRFFGGLSIEETAEVLGVSPETVKRDWRLSRFGSCARSPKAKRRMERRLDPERHQKIERLYHEAVSIAPERRAGFLAKPVPEMRACPAGGVAVRARIARRKASSSLPFWKLRRKQSQRTRRVRSGKKARSLRDSLGWAPPQSNTISS